MTNKDAKHIQKFLKVRCPDCGGKLRVCVNSKECNGISYDEKFIECENTETCGYQDVYVKQHKGEKLLFDE
jgi:hypothetical protein